MVLPACAALLELLSVSYLNRLTYHAYVLLIAVIVYGPELRLATFERVLK